MIYDYKCDECEEVFEVMHKISETCDVCPKCGHKKVTKQLGTPALITRGDGFHAGGFHAKGNK